EAIPRSIRIAALNFDEVGAPQTCVVEVPYQCSGTIPDRHCEPYFFVVGLANLLGIEDESEDGVVPCVDSVFFFKLRQQQPFDTVGFALDIGLDTYIKVLEYRCVGSQAGTSVGKGEVTDKCLVVK